MTSPVPSQASPSSFFFFLFLISKGNSHGKGRLRTLRQSAAVIRNHIRGTIFPIGQTLPTPKSIDLKPGALLGSVSGELGLRKYLELNGHTLVVTSDKDGANSVLDRELPDAEIVISQPFWPAYMTAERFAKAPKLKLIVTAGIGSDHTDLQAAMSHKVTVAEVTFCNSISVSEHVVMMILSLVRNYIPSYQWAVKGGWNIADCVERLMTSKACMSVLSPPAASGSPSCAV